MASYTDLVEFCKSRNETPPSRLSYWYQTSPLSAFSDNKFSIGCRIWLFFGRLFDYQRKWDKVRDESIKNARIALEEAFTPELKKMLEKKLIEDEER
jgi:hypothetical protein